MKCLQNRLSSFPANSHQVWGLLLTRFTLVHASIFANLRLCGAVGVPVYSPLGVPVVSRCPDHNSWKTCDCGVVRFHVDVSVSRRPVSRCSGFVVALPLGRLAERLVGCWCGRVVRWWGGVVEWLWGGRVALVGDSVAALVGVLVGVLFGVSCLAVAGVSVLASVGRFGR